MTETNTSATALMLSSIYTEFPLILGESKNLVLKFFVFCFFVFKLVGQVLPKYFPDLISTTNSPDSLPPSLLISHTDEEQPLLT